METAAQPPGQDDDDPRKDKGTPLLNSSSADPKRDEQHNPLATSQTSPPQSTVDAALPKDQRAEETASTGTLEPVDTSPMVSICRAASGPIEGNYHIAGLYAEIKGDSLKQDCDQIRAVYGKVLAETGDKKKAKKACKTLKANLPAFLAAGVFSQRGDDYLTQYSGLMVADLDYCVMADVRSTLIADSHVCGAFCSPTSGVKPIIRVAMPPHNATVAEIKEHHAACFRAVRKHFRDRYGLEVDEACKNLERLCFVSHDPSALDWRYDGVEPLEPLLEEEKSPASKPGNKPRAKNAENAVTKSKPKSVRENGNAKADMAGQKREPLFTLEADIVQGFLDEFPEDKDAKKIVKALPYVDPGSQETWLHVGMALKGRWGDSGWDLFDEWSGHGDGYDEDENSKRWDSFSEDAEGGIGLGTVFKLACENGWRFYEKTAVCLPTCSAHDFCKQVYKIIAPTNTLFLQGGNAVIVEPINGQPEIIALDAFKGIRHFETYIQFLRRTEKDGGPVYAPVALPEKTAKLLVKGVQPGEVPELRGITHCPPLVQRNDNDGQEVLAVAGLGFISETGWFNANQCKVKRPLLDQAIKKYKWLFREFEFATPGDRSRALLHPIGIAMKLSGLITGFVPMDFGTANDQQSGKGTLQRITAAFFGSPMEIITQSNSHIGSTSEMFKSACLAGKTFIQLDNFDHFDCREMEAFLTGENVRMRDAYGRSRSVDPADFFVFLSSNGLAARRDLALRSWFIRIIKKPERFEFFDYAEGGIVEHVAAHQAEYLGCVYSIVTEWWKKHGPRSNETRHNFREFTQVSDWIAQNLLDEGPVMAGHAEAIEQFSDAGRVFFSRLWDSLARQHRLDILFRAGQLATDAFRYSIPIPGLDLRHGMNERAAAKLIGGLAVEVFAESIVLDLGQGRTVERVEGRPDLSMEDWDEDYFAVPRSGKRTPCYIFKLRPEAATEGAPKEEHQSPLGHGDHDDLAGLNRNVLRALKQDGRTLPCNITTHDLARLLEACSEKSMGKWMGQLAERYPEQFSPGPKTRSGHTWDIDLLE